VLYLYQLLDRELSSDLLGAIRTWKDLHRLVHRHRVLLLRHAQDVSPAIAVEDNPELNCGLELFLGSPMLGAAYRAYLDGQYGQWLQHALSLDEETFAAWYSWIRIKTAEELTRVDLDL
jgi:hypothetical protein